MAQLVSSKNLLLSSQPLTVGVISQPGVLAEMAALPEGELARQCDLVELRLDQLKLPSADIRAAAEKLGVPLLLTARHPAEGGEGGEGAADRMALIQPLLDLAGIVDLELRSVPEMRPLIEQARTLSVPVVGSFHDFQATPGDEVLEGAISFAENAGLGAVKIAAYLNSAEDLIRLVRLVTKTRRLRLAAMGMGPWGRVSRLLLAKCGSLLNYGYLGESNAPGQWPAAKLRELLQEI